MIKLQPISEKDAPSEIAVLYQDIKTILHAPTVPLLFQYLGNFPGLYSHIWSRISLNTTTSFYKESSGDLTIFAQAAIDIIYNPSIDASAFVTTLTHEERALIRETITTLRNVNTEMLLLSVALRENIKGLFTETTYLKPLEETEKEAFIHSLVKETIDQELIDSEKLLVPLVGSRAISVSKYPDFFAYIASEMEAIIQTEAYLKSRVELEHLAINDANNLPYPLHTSFKEFMVLGGKDSRLYEMLYLLKDFFPTIYPRLLLTCCVMHSILEEQRGIREV
jgi:hypothetical protein